MTLEDIKLLKKTLAGLDVLGVIARREGVPEDQIDACEKRLDAALEELTAAVGQYGEAILDV